MKRTGPQLLTGTLAYALAVYVGRLTVPEGMLFAHVWPAAGAAVLWFLLRGRPLFSLDLAALVVAHLSVTAATDTPAALLVAGTVSTLAQLGVALWLTRRWLPHLWGCGGDQPLSRTADVGRLAISLTASALVGTAAGVVVFLAVGDAFAVGDAVVWASRVVCSTITVVAGGLITAHWLSHGRPRVIDWRRQGAEALLLGMFTVAVLSFVVVGDSPVAFLLLLATAWSGLRFSTLLTVWHSGVVAVVMVAATLQDHGPFSSIEDPLGAALVAQAFVTLVVLIGLFIAVGREERKALTADTEAAHRDLARQARLLEAILDAMPDGVAVLEQPWRVRLRNPAVVDLLGVDIADGLHLVAPRIFRPDGSPPTAQDSIAGRALGGEDLHNAELLVRRPDSGDVTLRVSATHLAPLEPGEPARAVMVFHDITADVDRTQELASFARVAAHDLGSPLAAMGGWISLLQRKADQGDLSAAFVSQTAERLGVAAARLQDLVDGLLQRAVSQDRSLTLDRIELDEVVRHVVESRSLEGVVEWTSGMPAVEADALLVAQSIDNLVGNAVKYVAPGVTPQVRVTAEETRPGWVRIRVADNGIGIPGGEYDKVFDEFHRAHRGYGGTGLGLSIVRRAVLRHGGTVAAMPNPDGAGTVVELTLPAA